MLVTKMAKHVANIFQLSLTHFVSNIRHQHQYLFSIVIESEFHMVRYGDKDHRQYAPNSSEKMIFRMSCIIEYFTEIPIFLQFISFNLKGPDFSLFILCFNFLSLLSSDENNKNVNKLQVCFLNAHRLNTALYRNQRK